jgi:hypothetical protein
MRSESVSPEVSFAAVRVSEIVMTAIFTGTNRRVSSMRDIFLPQ